MNAQLTTRLRHLRLSGMVDALPGRVAQAEAAPLPHLEFLELLVEDELARFHCPPRSQPQASAHIYDRSP
jgi:hypothetical protein